MMSTGKLEYYRKQFIFPEISVTVRENKAAASAFMATASGPGCPVLQFFTSESVINFKNINIDKAKKGKIYKRLLIKPDKAGRPEMNITGVPAIPIPLTAILPTTRAHLSFVPD